MGETADVDGKKEKAVRGRGKEIEAGYEEWFEVVS